MSGPKSLELIVAQYIKEKEFLKEQKQIQERIENQKKIEKINDINKLIDIYNKYIIQLDIENSIKDKFDIKFLNKVKLEENTSFSELEILLKKIKLNQKKLKQNKDNILSENDFLLSKQLHDKFNKKSILNTKKNEFEYIEVKKDNYLIEIINNSLYIKEEDEKYLNKIIYSNLHSIKQKEKIVLEYIKNKEYEIEIEKEKENILRIIKEYEKQYNLKIYNEDFLLFDIEKLKIEKEKIEKIISEKIEKKIITNSVKKSLEKIGIQEIDVLENDKYSKSIFTNDNNSVLNVFYSKNKILFEVNGIEKNQLKTDKEKDKIVDSMNFFCTKLNDILYNIEKEGIEVEIKTALPSSREYVKFVSIDEKKWKKQLKKSLKKVSGNETKNI